MRKNFPPAVERTPYKQHVPVSIVLTPEVFNKVREKAIEKDNSIASMCAVLIQAGLNK